METDTRCSTLPPQQVFYVPEHPNDVVYANGAIHWLLMASESVGESWDWIFYRGGSCLQEKCIFAFDMREEQFRKIPFPDDLSFPAYLAEFGGRLALMEQFVLWKRKSLGYDVGEYDKLQCWVLEDYKNPTWVKETIHLPFGWMRHNKVLAFNNNTGEMLLTSANMRRDKSNVNAYSIIIRRHEFFGGPKSPVISLNSLKFLKKAVGELGATKIMICLSSTLRSMRENF
jgi:hypothetical protein